MRNFWRFAGFLAFLAVLPCARAADLSGTWKGSFDYQGTTAPLTFHLTVAGSALTGTVEGLQASPSEIHDGKVDGNTVTFWVNADYQGQTYKLVYTGKVSAAGDEIAFNFGTEDGSWSAQMTAQRGAAPQAPQAASTPDVTGTWKGAFDFHGSSVSLTFHLASSAGAVTGTVEGLPTTPTEIHDGKMDGGTVTFWVNTDYQGQTYRLTYTGKIADSQIVFSFGTDDGSFTAQITAQKQGAASSQ
jgi:hypothetical protein